MTGLLKNVRVYLGGAVESHHSPNGWRTTISKPLETLGMVVLNPLLKPAWMPQIDAAQQRKMKETLTHYLNPIDRYNWCIEAQRIASDNNAIRQYCLALVRMADILIIYLDRTFTVGSFEELSIARGKPIFIISKDPIPSMWLMDQLNLYSQRFRLYVHKSIKSCIKTLTQIHHNKTVTVILPYLDPFEWIFLSTLPDRMANKYLKQPDCMTTERREKNV
jgi:hypothetical protein